MAIILNGNELTKEILDDLRNERKKFGKLRLVAFLIGETPEKLKFLEIKKEIAQKIDVDFRIYKIEENISRKKLRKYISQIIKSNLVQGAIIQLPLPAKFPKQYILNSIVPEKDVDCLSVRNLGKYFTNSYLIRPPAVEVVDFLKNKFNLDFRGKTIVVVGYSQLVGKPLLHYFASENSTIILLRGSTEEKEKFFEMADVVVSGKGEPNFINTCKEGAILIDFGYSIKNGKIFGDLNFERLKDKAYFITPTPNGTGPILVSMLFKNFLKLAEFQK